MSIEEDTRMSIGVGVQSGEDTATYRERVAIVTGGGSGIGRAAAVRFAALGARVLVVGRRVEPLEETARRGEGIAVLTADVGQDAAAPAVIGRALELWGRVDILVNNAGAFAAAPLQDTTAALVATLFATNVGGPTWLAQAALPHLAAARGAIVNVSSTYGHKATVGAAHYAASKAALEQLTRCWALELAPHGVRVNAVAPGPTDTPILARAGLSVEAIAAIQRTETARIPLGRRGTPEDVAVWIVALADPTVWVTGQVVAVDGGLSTT